MLKVEQLEGGYGKSQVLFQVNLEIADGEAVSMVGRNGMGKSTTIQTIMGMLPAKGGSCVIIVDGGREAARYCTR